MHPDFFDNRSKILKDDLVAHVQAGDKMSVAASVFSMYAYRELRAQLDNLDEFRFIYTSPAFLSERGHVQAGDKMSVAASVFSMYAYRELRAQLDNLDEFRFIYTSPAFLSERGKKEQREFYIPRLDRERGVGGTDLEIRLRNELTQKAIATECAQWIREKAAFKSFKGAAGLPPSLTVEMAPSADRAEADVASYIPFNGFTTVELGAARSTDAYGVICRQDGTSSRMLLNTFEQAWSSGDLDDVTDAVVDNISQMYRENPPALVYYAALYRIFHEFLDDITADELPKEGAGFRESKYIPFNGFTTVELGAARSTDAYGVICRQDGTSSRMLLNTFEKAWSSGDLDDVTDAVVDNISQMYRENPPELVYYAALYRIFHEFLDDITADELPKEGAGFRESKIWNLLYDFQRDAVLAIINKLQTYDGCILADSVGLGKTFTALAVVKYYESLNRNVLVLCPKKLGDNWLTYRNNQRNNPIASDRLRYDVLYHTDLSRQRGTSVTGLDLETINWGAYDLVVIDESHNFRNGADSSRSARDGEEASGNRYERLLNRVVKDGVPTKVLMLSATPVNNRFRDLRNQLALAYQGDPEQWSERLGLESNVEDVFRRAQGAFTRWSELPTEERTTEALTRSLDFDFFRILDQVTVARSRNHIQRYYDAAAIGPFPQRNKPVSLRPDLCTEDGPATYDTIAERLYSRRSSASIRTVRPSPVTCWRTPTASTMTWTTRRPRSSWWVRRPAMTCATWTGSAGSATSWLMRGSCATFWISLPRSTPSATPSLPRSSGLSRTRSPVPSTPLTARSSSSPRSPTPRTTSTSNCARWWWTSWAWAWPRSRVPPAARPRWTACVPTSRRSSPASAPSPRSATRCTRAWRERTSTGVPAPGGKGHRCARRHGLHLRGPEPAGLRLPGQLLAQCRA